MTKLHLSHRQFLQDLFISIVTALFIVHFCYGLAILDPTNINWLMSAHHDWGTHYLGWANFRDEAWRFPIGSIESYNYPIGTNIGFTDSIPLLAIIFKPFSSLLPDDFQYFGFWLFMCHLLSAYYVLKIFRYWKAPLFYSILVVILISANPVQIFRELHPALYSQWIIIASIYNYIRKGTPENSRRINIMQSVLLLLSAAITPYLTAMLLGMSIIIPFKHYLYEKAISFRELIIYPAVAVSSVALLWLLIGLIEFGPRTNFQAAESFSKSSFNLNSFFNGYGHYSNFIPDLGRTNPQQYEGFAYLGIGICALIVIVSIWYLLLLIPNYKRYWFKLQKYIPLVILSIICALFAITNEVSFGTETLFKLPLPNIIEKAGFVFRASGRFIWPLYYTICVAVLILFWRIRRPLIFKTAVLLFLTIVQFWDIENLITYRDLPSGPYNTPLSDHKWISIMKNFDGIIVYPPFTYNYSMTYEMDYQDYCYLALKAGKPISNGYVARTNLEKSEAFREKLMENLQHGEIDDKQLYITVPEHLGDFAVLIRNNSVNVHRLNNFIFIFSKATKVRPSNFENSQTSFQYIDSIKTFYKNQKPIEFTPLEVNLKDEGKILHYFDKYEFQNNVIKLRGWAFLKESNNNSNDSLFLSASTNEMTYKIPLKTDKRPDITTAYKKEYLDDAGFYSTISTKALPRGTYNLGIIIKNKQGVLSYQKTENTIQIK